MAFAVPDAEEAYRVAVERGAEGVREPDVLTDEHGKVVVAAIRAYGDTLHSFVDASKYSGVFLPGYVAADPFPVEPVGLKLVDHVVANVELGRMDDWVDFYAA